MNISFDGSDLNALSADLTKAGKVAPYTVRDVVTKGALNVKNEAAQMASGLAHAPHYPASITFDVKFGANSVEAEIGPDKDRRQGALGNILEYGTSKNAPVTHLGPALDREGPRFEQAISKAFGDVL